MTIFDPASGKSPKAPSTYNTDNIQFHTVENEFFFNFFAHRKCHKGGIHFRLQRINANQAETLAAAAVPGT